MEENLDGFLMAPIEYVESVLMEDWSEDYAASEHLNKYWTAVSARSDDQWPGGLTENWDKLFVNDERLVPEIRVEALIDHLTQHPTYASRPRQDATRSGVGV